MQRYFIKNDQIEHNEIRMTNPDDVHHIRQVMRMTPGTKIVCTDEHEQAYLCIIKEITETIVHASVIEMLDNSTELPVEVTIFQGLPKKNKLEFVIQKGTELGCAHFKLFPAERSIVKWDHKKRIQNTERLRRIAKEASEQSERRKVPTVEVFTSLKDILNNHLSYDMMFFAYEEEARTKAFNSLATALHKCNAGMKIGIFIGPEGGFSNNEITTFKQYGIQPIRLGARILRTETASIYTLACISYHFEEMRWQ